MRRDDLRDKVRAACSSAAEQPEPRHPFPVGRAFAESLGYPPAWQDEIPQVSVDAFTGVSSAACFVDVPEHSTVLDMGCGAGLDSMLIARHKGVRCTVVGVEFSWAMLKRARCAAAAIGAANVLFCQGAAEGLPLRDGAVDVAMVNGIFNLNPAREAIFRELARCIRPGGWLYGAELILQRPLPAPAKAGTDNWFA